MPTLSVGQNIEYFYEDSGPVEGGTYTTLVFVHGMGFNGGVYKKLFTGATKHNVRIVAINRRDYSPSSAFKEEELKLLGDGSPGLTKFWHKIGVDLALFLAEYIKTSGVPAPSGSGGGVVPVGWSLGASTVNAMLSAIDEVPQDALDTLNKYVKTVIFHDPSSTAFGFTNPSEYNIDLWFEPDVEKRFSLFKDWATAYYEHKDILPGSGSNATLNFNDYAKRPYTLSDLSAEEVKQLTSASVFGGSDTTVLYGDPAVSKAIVKRAIFDKALAAKLPARIRYYYGGETPGVLVWTCWELEKAIKDPSMFDGEQARDVKVVHTKKGNHLVFWDEPEVAMEGFRQCLD